MHCHIASVEFAGKPTQVFLCGSGPQKRFCRFCGAKATALCDWPRVRVVNMPFDQIKVGDEVVAHSRSKQIHRLVYLKSKPELGEVWLATEWRGHVMQRVEAQPWRGLWVPQQGTCDTPTCFRHHRRVAPDRHYCQRHWRAWEQVS